jgi:hypothetical protein
MLACLRVRQTVQVAAGAVDGRRLDLFLSGQDVTRLLNFLRRCQRGFLSSAAAAAARLVQSQEQTGCHVLRARRI